MYENSSGFSEELAEEADLLEELLPPPEQPLSAETAINPERTADKMRLFLFFINFSSL
jgi:hypothetical protein